MKRVFLRRLRLKMGEILELVLRNEGKFWYRVPCCCFLVDGCYFHVASGWVLLFPSGLWMAAVISWWALDGWCYFLVSSGWLLFFPAGLCMVAAICWWPLDEAQ